MQNLKPPFRRAKVANDRPKDCTECKNKVCLETKKPCAAVERWISQDFRNPSPHKEVMLNGAAGDTDESKFDFVDIMYLNHGVEIGWDSDEQDKAMEILKGLNISKKSWEYLELYYLEGKRNCEIAEILGITDQAVDMRHQTAKRELIKKKAKRDYWEKIKDEQFPTELSRNIGELYFDRLLKQGEIASELGVWASTVSANVNKILRVFGDLT